MTIPAYTGIIRTGLKRRIRAGLPAGNTTTAGCILLVKVHLHFQSKKLYTFYMKIRKTEPADLPEVMNIYHAAQTFMKEHGNASQWSTVYPEQTLIESDIKEGTSYVCIADNKIAAVFTFKTGADNTYAEIFSGHWLNDRTYGVVHRIASSREVKGCAAFCLQWAFKQCGNIRIDTHRDNIPMQHLLAKEGYTQCGIIHTYDGTERLAFQKEKSC